MTTKGKDNVPDGISGNYAGTDIRLRAAPRASRTCLYKSAEDVYRIRIAAPPVDGAANKEIILYLAKLLGVSKNSIRMLHGYKGKLKVFRVQGIEEKTVRSKFEEVAK